MVFSHLLSVGHGIGAALLSLAAFYVTGLLLRPRRWQSSIGWPDCFVFGLTAYVLLCWIATSSRHIPVVYVMLLFGAAAWALAAIRFRWLRATVGSPRTNPRLRQWLIGFTVLYVFAYLLVGPPAGPAFLTLPSDGALDLVTYARYAKHLLLFGTANVDLATFGYLHSPASAYLLAWHSTFFLGDQLDAAMPLLFMLAALFGALTVDVARSAFGLPWRVSLVIAGIAMSAPVFRWTLATYSLRELMSAVSLLYLAGVVGRAASARSIGVARIFSIVMGITLLFFSAWFATGLPGRIARGVVEVGRHFSLLALVGFPSGTPLAAKLPELLPSAALVVLPLVPLVWAAAAWALRRLPALQWTGASDVDRRLGRALVVYVAAAVIVGNVAVQAVSRRPPVHWPGAWRELNQLGRIPFRSFTLKVTDEPNGLSTALAMYYMPGRKAQVIGRGVSLDDLPVEHISRQEPLFIQSFGCQGVGHGDAVSAPGVGCLLMAPPSMTVGTSYPFNQTFLFLDFDRMTSREPGGRWNTHTTLNLRLTADPQRASLDREMYVNLLVNPFFPPGATPMQLMLRWGTGRGGEVLVGERQWFSLPVGSDDWKGNRLWTVPVAIDFPEGGALLFHEVSLTDAPRGKVAGQKGF